jgi:hypothetical protein
MAYGIHGVDVTVTSDDELIVELVDHRLRSFRREAGRIGRDEVCLSLSAVADPGSYRCPLSGGRRSVYDPPEGEVLYYHDADQLHLHNDEVTSRVDLAAGRVDTWFRGDTPSASWLASHPFLTLALMEVLRRRSRYCLHAAACVVDGRVVLVPGGSGAGKTTVAVAMVRAGAGFMGDDTVLLSPDPDGVSVFGFPDEINLTDGTARMFAEVAHLVGAPRMAGARKHRIRPENVFGRPSVMRGRPAVLVFPVVGDAEDNRVRPMSQAEALVELVPNVLLTEPATAQAHLDVLGQLVQRCHSFRLLTGRRVEEIPGVVQGLLASS